jgi:hypothetical protein
VSCTVCVAGHSSTLQKSQSFPRVYSISHCAKFTIPPIYMALLVQGVGIEIWADAPTSLNSTEEGFLQKCVQLRRMFRPNLPQDIRQNLKGYPPEIVKFNFRFVILLDGGIVLRTRLISKRAMGCCVSHSIVAWNAKTSRMKDF